MQIEGDENVTLASAKSWIKEFCRERDWDPYHGPKDLAIGLVTEASELLEIFRFRTDRDCLKIVQEASAREGVADELADAMYFILRFAERFEFDLAKALKNKLAKNATKYPVPNAKR